MRLVIEVWAIHIIRRSVETVIEQDMFAALMEQEEEHNLSIKGLSALGSAEISCLNESNLIWH